MAPDTDILPTGAAAAAAAAPAPAPAPAPDGSFTLQILHASDFEAGLAAPTRASQFAAIVDRLEDSQANSITLSSGDNYIPSPFNAAGTDPSVKGALQELYAWLLDMPAAELSGLALNPSAVDIAIMNALGVQASVFGNHEWDFGAAAAAAVIDFTKGGGTTAAAVTSIGAMFPYLSANIDFASAPSMAGLFTAALRDAASYATTAADLASPAALAAEAADAQVSPWTTIEENGETIGVLGVTTQQLAALTGRVAMLDPAGDGGVDNTDELAGILQVYVDQMTAQGIDKIILLSHLQLYPLELELAGKLSGVDVIVAGGSHVIFADGGDRLTPGDTAGETYPMLTTGADGKPVAIVNTGNEYSYVGRLVVTFDANGEIVPDSIDAAVSGAYAVDEATVEALWGEDDAYAEGTRGGAVRGVTDAVAAVVEAKDGNLLGFTDVYLEGRREAVRAEETNLGNLAADADLYLARQVDASVSVALLNGGGIRAEIGAIGTGPGAGELPPQGNPDAGKPVGAISQLDIENSLRFNNPLALVTVTAAELVRIFEHAVSEAAPGALSGSFGQVGGIAFSYDATATAQLLGTDGSVLRAGARVQNLVILGDDGAVRDTVMVDGALAGDGERGIRMVTLSYLADGGGGYPIGAYGRDRVELLDNAALSAGAATFSAPGTEQDALAEYLKAKHGTAETAYDQADGSAATDTRVQNLAERPDGVLGAQQLGGAAADTLLGGTGRDFLQGLGGDDRLEGRGGSDRLDGGAGFDTAVFTGSLAGHQLARAGDALLLTGGDGPTTLVGIEQLRFADGTIRLGGSDPLFDRAGYYIANADVFAAGVDAQEHYRRFGAAEGRDPNAVFDTGFYLAAHRDVAAAGMNPLEHYRQFGAAEGRDVSAGFDTAGYLALNPDVARAGLDPLAHYLEFGRAEGRPTALAVGPALVGAFDIQFYRAANADVVAAGVDAFAHWTQFGAAEQRDPNAYFDVSYYLAANADVAAAGVNPLDHYGRFGFREGRDPSARFDSSAYLAANPDVAAADIDPLEHYLRNGLSEGRQPVPVGAELVFG